MDRYEILLTVAEEGSFTRAAQKLGYSQPAVSQAVNTLEKECGTALVTRGRDGVHLTRDGEMLLPYMRSYVNGSKSLFEAEKRLQGLMGSVIRIGTFTSVSRVVLPVLMSEFHQKYPDVRFVLRQGEYDAIRAWIEDGSIDFGFFGRSSDPKLRIDPLYQDRMAAVLPAGHPLAEYDVIPLEKLCEEPFIQLDEGESSTPLQVYDKHHLSLEAAYKIYDDYSILAMIRQGMGVSILYELVIHGFADDLVIRPLSSEISRTVSLVCRDYETMPRAARAFYTFIQKRAGQIVERALSI